MVCLTFIPVIVVGPLMRSFTVTIEASITPQKSQTTTWWWSVVTASLPSAPPTYSPHSLSSKKPLMASLTLSDFCDYFCCSTFACMNIVHIWTTCQKGVTYSISLMVHMCVLVFKLAKWCAKMGLCVGEPGCSEYLGLPRLPNWIVPSDMADLHNLVVSFTASHGLGDEWHPQKIIFLLGCNKSYVKCSTAYIAMTEMWLGKKGTLFFILSPVSLVLFFDPPKSNLYLQYLSMISWLQFCRFKLFCASLYTINVLFFPSV